MKMKTTIQISSKTLVKLKRLKIAKRESYDEMLNRLINKVNEVKNDM